MEKNEEDIIEDIKNVEFEDGKKRVLHKKKYFTSLVINRYTNPRRKNVMVSDKEMQKIRKKSMLIWRAYEDGKMPEKRQKSLDKTNRKTSAGAIQAHKTRREQEKIARKLYGTDFKKLSESRKKNIKKIIKSKQR